MATVTAPSGLEKAYFSFVEPTASGTGPSTTVNGQPRIEFKFNPKEYSIQKSAEWTRKPATGAKQTSPPEFTGSQPRQLSLEMFLDESGPSGGDVSREVETLFACLTPLPRTLTDQKPVPPFVQFGWGRKVLFTAFLKSVSARYTLFRPDGTPIRATCTVSLEEVPAEPGRQNPTSGSRHAMRSHQVVMGDSLMSIAYQEYGDSTLWRAIALANDIDDPLRLPTGLELRVPARDELNYLL